MAERHEQLAEALERIAGVNHYMVGIVEPFTLDELDQAEQILIDKQNALPVQSGRTYKRLNLALDLVDVMRRRIDASARNAFEIARKNLAAHDARNGCTREAVNIGERAICGRCGQDIEWNGETWWDRGGNTTCGPYQQGGEIVQADHTKPHRPSEKRQSNVHV